MKRTSSATRNREARALERFAERVELESRREELAALVGFIISTPRANLSSTKDKLQQGQTEGVCNKPLQACGGMSVVVSCACGRHRLPSLCGKRDCGKPDCVEKVQARRALRTFWRFEDGGKPWLSYTVFTVPPLMRAKLADPKLWAKVRRGAWEILKKWGAAAWGVEATHPIGDPLPCACGYPSTEWKWGSSPLCAFCPVCESEGAPAVFHPHLNFLWCRGDGRQPFIDLEELRAAWSRLLEKLAGLGAGPAGAVAYHRYESREHAGKWKHLCAYVTRLFPGLHGWTGCLRWYGDPPGPRPAPDCTCEKCGQEMKSSRPMPHWKAEEEVKRLPAPRPLTAEQRVFLGLETVDGFEIEPDG